MRVTIGLAILGASIYFFGWWGFFSLIFVLPFIGWKDRHKGPFPVSVSTGKLTNHKAAKSLSEEVPKSFRFMQDILLKASKKSTNPDDLVSMLSQLNIFLMIERPIDIDLTTKQRLIKFTELYSDIFPNWQSEYSLLEDLINSRLS